MIQFKFGSLIFEGSLAIGFMNAGICIDDKASREVFNCCLNHFKNHDFAYITVRKNSYSVDPLVYMDLSKLENFKAMAIVTVSTLGNSSAEIEKMFLKKPLKEFDNEKDAKKWALEILEDDIKKGA